MQGDRCFESNQTPHGKPKETYEIVYGSRNPLALCCLRLTAETRLLTKDPGLVRRQNSRLDFSVLQIAPSKNWNGLGSDLYHLYPWANNPSNFLSVCEECDVFLVEQRRELATVVAMVDAVAKSYPLSREQHDLELPGLPISGCVFQGDCTPY